MPASTRPGSPTDECYRVHLQHHCHRAAGHISFRVEDSALPMESFSVCSRAGFLCSKKPMSVAGR